MTYRPIIRLMALGAISATAIAAAEAQDSTTQPRASQPDYEDASNDIVVTATRREAGLGKVPISVSALTSEALDAQGVKNMEDISRITPGVTFERGNNGGSQISIRGLKSTAGASTTGVYIDDTPIQARALGNISSTIYPAVFDIERVEILRGPQGTLFGAGSQGGTVRFITPQPSYDGTSLYARSEIAFTETGDPSFEAGAAVGTAIVKDRVALRISGWARHDGGYIDRIDRNSGLVQSDNSNSQNSYVGKIALGFKPLEELTITPSFFYQEIRKKDGDGYWEYLSDPDEGRFINGSLRAQPFKGRTYLPSLNIHYDGPGFSITSNTSYYAQHNRFDRDLTLLLANIIAGVPTTPANPVPGYPQYQAGDYTLTRQQGFAQEIRLASTNDSPLQWVVGGFYQRTKSKSHQFVVDAQPNLDNLLTANGRPTMAVRFPQYAPSGLLNGNLLYDSSIDAVDEQIAGFGEANLKLFDQLTLIAGVRVSKTKYSATTANDGPINGGRFSSFTGEQSESPITPRFGLSYEIDRRNMVYATASKGFRVGGANAPVPATCDAELAQLGYSQSPNTFDSDTVWNYELGSKNQLFDGKLRVNSSAFYLKWKGIQTTLRLPRCAIAFVANLGEATSRGFDVQADAQITDNLTLGLAVGYNKTRYSDTITVPAAIPGTPDPVISRKGNSLGNRPWTVTVVGQYDFDLAGHDSYLRADYSFASAQKVPTPLHDPRNATWVNGLRQLGETNIVNARIGTRFGDGVELSLFVNNLLDSHPFVTQVTLGAAGVNTVHWSTTFRPRTYGLTLQVRK